MSEKRDLIVVDTETTGLDPELHWVLEVAAINVTTGEEMYFAPFLPEGALDNAEGKAMKVNRYFERGVYEHRLDWETSATYWRKLWDWLKGNTLAGANPAFDAAMLNRSAIWGTGRFHKSEGVPPSPWHHRLADLEAYSAAALHLPPTELSSLSGICKALDVEIVDAHSALGDARATAECFRRLTQRYTDQGLPKAAAV